MRQKQIVGMLLKALVVAILFFYTLSGMVPAASDTTGPHKVTVDKDRRCVLVDGKPFFALVCTMVDEEHFRQAKDMGFNTAGRFGFEWSRWSQRKVRTSEDVRQYLDKAYEAGLMVIEWPEAFGEGDPAGEAKPFPKFRSYIKTKLPVIIDNVKNHPALLAYYGPDEPNLWEGLEGATSEQSHQLLAQFSNTIRSHDPNHLIHVGFAGKIPESWGDSFDVAGDHVYAWFNLPLGLTFAGNPRKTLNCTQSRSAVCEQLGKPYWHTCLLHPYYNHHPFNSRMISPQEQRMQAYLAVIGGAKGLYYYHWPPTTEAASSGLKTVFGELREIAPAVMEQTPKFDVQYKPADLRAVLPLLVKDYQGKSYLIVANCGRFPVEARFSLPLKMGVGSGEAEVMFTDRRLKIADGQFSERMDAFETRVYRLACPWPESGRLEVALTPQPVKNAGPTADLQRLLSLGGPNLVSDPRFADANAWPPRTEKYGDHDNGGKGEVVKDTRANETMLHLRTSDQKGKNVCLWAQTPVLLEAQSRYLFAVRGRRWAEADGVARAALIPMDAKNQGASGWFHFDGGAWLILPDLGLQPDTIGMTFVTGSQPFSVRPLCRLVDGPGDAWYHEMIVKKLPNSKNILRNSGFEQEGAPGEPRYWTLDFGTAPVVAGDPDPRWTLDRKEKHEGAASLRISHPKTSDVESLRGEAAVVEQQVFYGFQKGDEMTLSFYAKADNAGVNLPTGLEGAGGQLFHLTTEWQRYSVPLTIKEKNDRKRLWFMVGGATPGKAWIDNVQLEAGSKATEYEDGGW